MKKIRMFSLIILTVCLSAFFSAAAMAADTIDLPITVTEDYDKANELLELINARRHELNVMNDLQMDAKLQDIAMQRAAELAVSFDHRRPDGSNRDISGTYPNIRGDNIAVGQWTSELVFNNWKSSTLHGPVMNDKYSNYCGIGCVEYEGSIYWTLDTSAEAMGAVSTRSGKAEAKRMIVTDKSKIVFDIYDWNAAGHEPYVNTIGMYYGKAASAGVVIKNFYDSDVAGIGYRCDPSMLAFSGGTPGVATVSPNGVVDALSTGSASLTVALKGDSRVSTTVPFDIESNVLLGEPVIRPSRDTFPYTGDPITLDLTVTDCFGNLMKEGQDYRVEYKNNINPGIAYAYVRVMGNYDSPFLAGANFYAVSFRIEDSTAGSTQKQPGNEGTPSTADGNTGGDPSTSRDDAASGGVSTGSREPADLKPAAASISSLKVKAKGKLNVKWKKRKGVTGYQVQYALNKKFTKNKKTVKVAGYKKTSVTLTKLKRGKTYYVRIRTYKKVKGKTYYSSWSKAKNKRTR